MVTKAKHKDINDELFWRLDAEMDEDTRMGTMDEIVENNIRFVHYMINKTFGTRGVAMICRKQKITPDDFFSCGLEGLYEAVNTFDIHRGVKFSTYAARPIINHIIKMFRKTSKSEKDISMDKPLYMDDSGKDLSLGDTLYSEVNGITSLIEDEGNSFFLDKLGKVLDDREKELLYLRFYLELNQIEIGTEMGISQVQVSRLLKGIFKRAKKLYYELEGEQ